MGRQWFKHWSNASNGASLRSLWDSGNYEAYAFYWRLLECLCQWEDKTDPGSMTIHPRSLCRELGWNMRKLSRNLSETCSILGYSFEEVSGGFYLFRFPKWLELQTSWGGKRDARLEQESGRSKKLEVRSKKYKSSENSPAAQSALADTQNHKLVEIWNQECGTLPKVRILSNQRGRKAKAAWSRHPSEEFWIQVIARIRASPFCTGSSDRGWVANFDFLVKPDTPARVLEGVYDRRDSMGFTQEQIEQNRRMRDELDRSFEDSPA